MIIFVPGVASFVLAETDSTLVARAYADVSHADIVDAYLTTALPFALQACGRHEAMHASAVYTRDGSVAAFCGPSGSGKSTIAFGLGMRDHRQWADDALVFRVADDGVVAVAVPFTPKLREATAVHFGVSDVELPETPSSPEVAEARLGSLFVIEVAQRGRAAAEEAHFERLAPSTALRTVLPNAFRFLPDSRLRRREMLSAYLDLISEVAVWRVRYPQGLERLDSLLDAIDARIFA